MRSPVSWSSIFGWEAFDLAARLKAWPTLNCCFITVMVTSQQLILYEVQQLGPI